MPQNASHAVAASHCAFLRYASGKRTAYTSDVAAAVEVRINNAHIGDFGSPEIVGICSSHAEQTDIIRVGGFEIQSAYRVSIAVKGSVIYIILSADGRSRFK